LNVALEVATDPITDSYKVKDFFIKDVTVLFSKLNELRSKMVVELLLLDCVI